VADERREAILCVDDEVVILLALKQDIKRRYGARFAVAASSLRNSARLHGLGRAGLSCAECPERGLGDILSENDVAAATRTSLAPFSGLPRLLLAKVAPRKSSRSSEIQAPSRRFGVGDA